MDALGTLAAGHTDLRSPQRVRHSLQLSAWKSTDMYDILGGASELQPPRRAQGDGAGIQRVNKGSIPSAIRPPKLVIFSDLDGTLLDHDTYSWEPATGVLSEIERRNVPLVFVTSKTRSEVEVIRHRLGHRHPFVIENGGAAYVPLGYFPFRVSAKVRGSYEVLEWGTPYRRLVKLLKAAAGSARCSVRGFADMAAPEIAERCNLPLKSARLAMRREYDEPFVLDQTEERSHDLVAAVTELGLTCTRGGRFWHISGAPDKAVAVTALRDSYRQAYGGVRTVGLGDAPNDASFLALMDVPVVVRSPYTGTLSALVPDALVTTGSGPHGWAEGVLEILENE